MTQSREVISAWISALQEQSRKLTKWEADFVDSIEDQFSARGRISERQTEILEKIYAEKTS